MLELAALLTAIQATRKLVTEGAELVASIRKGFAGRNEEVRAELTAKLQSIEEQLANIGRVAEVAESYLRTYDNIRDLLATCEELVQFVKDSGNDLIDSRNATYARGWERISSVYRRLGEDSVAPQKVMLDRAEWYDERDKIQIAGKLKEFSSAYDRAKGFIEGRKMDGVKSELEQMQRPLADAETLLSSTLYEQILPSLQTLRA